MNALTKTMVLTLILVFSTQALFGGATRFPEGESRTFSNLRRGVTVSLRILGSLISGPLESANITGIDVSVLGVGDHVLTRFRYESRRNRAGGPDFRMTGESRFLTIDSPLLRVTIVRDGRKSK